MGHDSINSNPNILSGKPVIRGMRIPVATIVRWLDKGISFEELLFEYPTLTRDDILAAQEYSNEARKP